MENKISFLNVLSGKVFTFPLFLLYFIKISKLMLQEEIMKLGEYFRGIEYFNDALIVKVQFPIQWKVFPTKNGEIKPAEGDTKGEYFYYGNSNNVTLDDIFNVISETIAVNKDAEQKVQFLIDKRRELDELFKVTPFEKLKTLKFVFEEAKIEKPKRKYTKKKKAAQEEIKEPIEETNEEVAVNEEVKEDNA